ncbi:hypothetical protein [Liquorilactobacillus mali]|uniref:Cell division protein n=1 Tax=Liquorilactobacillus mali TaxID=1618 RepID=A0A0R2FQB4_9LACO|nr:hypothetical protein [Liquorilactobacillus mali]KRN29835.1 hypothetical protein IV36_GL000383 [Liquorilactobacillus mali]
MKSFQKHLLVVGCLISFSILLVLPQCFSGGIILGPDFLFHYNRFYDTAMQIKNGNFQYFISTYGFQQSGRIVNALYGPIFAYLQGILLLLSRTWYNYQIFSRLVLNIIASFSMYYLMRTARIKIRVAVPMACFYLTTFSIQDWTFRQGFTSWGAAVIPFALIPAFKYITDHKINSIQLALCVSLLLQIHVLSTILLVITYIPFFTYGLLKSSTPKKDIFKICIAIFIFLLLTMNIWTVLLAVSHSNNLVLPFINKQMYSYSVTEIGCYWLFTSLPLTAIIVFLLYLSIKKWHSHTPLAKICSINFFVFSILSTSIFPWYLIIKYKIRPLEIFQFPFRFFVIVTIFACVLFAYFLSNHLSKSNNNKIYSILLLIVLVGLFQTTTFANKKYEYWTTSSSPLKNLGMLVFNSENDKKIHDSLYSTDLNSILKLVQKKTPDYLPSYHNNTKKNYALYSRYIISANSHFIKRVRSNSLVVTWYAKKRKTISVPIIKYRNTKLILNGQKITGKKHKYHLIKIGTPVVRQKKGKNKLVVSYNAGNWFLPVMYIVIITWFSCLTYIWWKLFRKLKK